MIGQKSRPGDTPLRAVLLARFPEFIPSMVPPKNSPVTSLAWDFGATIQEEKDT